MRHESGEPRGLYNLMGGLFDHLIGNGKQLCWDGDAPVFRNGQFTFGTTGAGPWLFLSRKGKVPTR